MGLAMAAKDRVTTNILQHADLSTRQHTDLSEAERAELKRRYDDFMNHLRAGILGKTPAPSAPSRVRKWRPQNSAHKKLFS